MTRDRNELCAQFSTRPSLAKNVREYGALLASKTQDDVRNFGKERNRVVNVTKEFVSVSTQLINITT